MAADLDTLWGLLTDVDGKCDEMLKFKAVHQETHKRMDGQLTDINKALYAKPEGLSYVVAHIIQNCKSHEAVRLQKKAFMSSLLNKLATAAIIALVGWLLLLYRSHAPDAHGTETGQPGTTAASENPP